MAQATVHLKRFFHKKYVEKQNKCLTLHEKQHITSDENATINSDSVHSSVDEYKQKASLSLKYKSEASICITNSCTTHWSLTLNHFFFFPFPFLLPSPC